MARGLLFMARRKGEPRLPLPCGYGQLNSHTRIIVDEALRRHITVEIVDPVLGELCLRLGDRTVTTLESLSELTHAVAFRRCDDKLLTRRVLGQANLPIVPGQAATFDDTDQRFLEQYRDLVVKPVRGEQGRGISVGVTTPDELRRACEYARQYWPEVLLEQRWVGEDLRVVVINAEMVAAAIRRPPTVTGTGSETLYQLIDQHRRQRVLDMGTGSTVPVNEAARATLRAAGFDDLEVVLPEGVTVTFLRTANVHTGGTIEDVTEGLHPALEGLAVAAAAAVDLPVAGIDLIIDGVDAPGGAIIEVNEQPGLANHEPRPTAGRFVDLLFPETRALEGGISVGAQPMRA